jgi:acylphosphatase
MPEVLEKLFRSKAEIKFLRLFLNNPNSEYLLSEAAQKSKTNSATSRKEINNLLKVKFLLSRKKVGKTYYRVNQDFIFYDELKKIIFKTSPTSSDKIKYQVSKLGQVRFLLISGVFMNSDKGKVDIMIVGEHMNKSKLKNFLYGIEAEAGKGINYVCMSTDEFRYRKGMFDKFVINILESPHRVLIDRMKGI